MQPTGGIICRYDGFNGSPFHLTDQTDLDAAAAQALADQFAQLPLNCQFCSGTYYCPFDDGAMNVVVFSYVGRPDVALWLKGNGCSTIANGFILVDNLADLPCRRRSGGMFSTLDASGKQLDQQPLNQRRGQRLDQGQHRSQ